MNEELIIELASSSGFYTYELKGFFAMLEEQGYTVVEKNHKEIKDVCRAAEVTFVGVQEFKGRHLVYFNHTSNSSTLTLWLEDGFTPGKIREKIEQSIKKCKWFKSKRA